MRRIGPHSPLGLDCLWAFGVGGGICLLGEVLRQSYLAKMCIRDRGVDVGPHSALLQVGQQEQLFYSQQHKIVQAPADKVPVRAVPDAGEQLHDEQVQDLPLKPLAAEKLFLLPYLKKGRVWLHLYTLFLVVVGWAMFEMCIRDRKRASFTQYRQRAFL